MVDLDHFRDFYFIYLTFTYYSPSIISPLKKWAQIVLLYYIVKLSSYVLATVEEVRKKISIKMEYGYKQPLAMSQTIEAGRRLKSPIST